MNRKNLIVTLIALVLMACSSLCLGQVSILRTIEDNEWEDTPQGNQPHYFTARDGSPVLTVAGLWDEWKNVETGEMLKSCTMIITAPNDFVAEVHDRMPVLLGEKEFEPWLNGDAGVEILKPAANDLLQRWPVSKRVNSSRASDDDPTLIINQNELVATMHDVARGIGNIK